MKRELKDGDHCVVTGGTHKGKTGTVRDLNTSKTGQLTLTVVQQNGERFKTLAKMFLFKKLGEHTLILSVIFKEENQLIPICIN